MYNPPPPINPELVNGPLGKQMPSIHESMELADGFGNSVHAPNYSRNRVVGKAPELGMGYGLPIDPPLPMKDGEIIYSGYDVLHIPSSPENFTPKYTYREACMLNCWDPDLPPTILLSSDELEKAPDPVLGSGGTNPKTLMGRTKVPNLSVVPMTALIQEARAMEYGAFHSPRKDGGKGYGPFNWRDNDIEYMTYVEAAFRHIMSAADREDIDPETGEHKISHLALARATLGILIDAIEHGTVLDNRPTNARGVVAELLRKYRKTA